MYKSGRPLCHQVLLGYGAHPFLTWDLMEWGVLGLEGSVVRMDRSGKAEQLFKPQAPNWDHEQLVSCPGTRNTKKGGPGYTVTERD